MKKELGVLCHVTSLSNKYGVGDFGECCYKFIDFLSSSKIKIWQILPLNNTNKYNCPYGTMSSYTFDEMFVDLEEFVRSKKISKKELSNLKKLKNTKKIDYETVKKEKLRIFESVYRNLNETEKNQVEKFAKNNFLMFDYGYYRILLEKFDIEDWHSLNKNFLTKDSKERFEFIKENKEEILKHVFFQMTLKTQWKKVKEYADRLNIKILGDLPIYVEKSSFDVFENPEYFKLDKNYNPKVFGGVPPDDFCENGQNWGTCIWNWKKIKEDDYKYIINRINETHKNYSYLRLDHYAGYVEHYEIDAKDTSKGKWLKEAGLDFFEHVKKNCRLKDLVVEDLGIITKEGEKVQKQFKLKGMNILQFAFDGNMKNKYLPANVKKNSIYYLGTHDNNTFIGFLRQNKKEKENLIKIFDINCKNNKKILIESVKKMLKSESETIILQIQDFLFQVETQRTNFPGTLKGCFEYRVPKNFHKRFKTCLKLLKWE